MGGEDLPMPTVRFLVVCTSFGRTLAQEMSATGRSFPLSKSKGVAKGLMEVGDIPLINYWKNSAEASPRLLPVEQKMYILCNDDNYEQYVAWAKNPKLSCGGFPVSHVISNGASAKEHSGIISDIDIFIQKTGDHATDLVVVEGDYLFHPSFNLQRIVEHAIVRGKDTVTYLNLKDAEHRPHHKMIEFATEGSNPKVECIKAHPAVSETSSLAAVAPLYVFRKSTLPKLQAFLRDTPGLSLSIQAAQFFAYLPTAAPLYALNVGHVFDVKSTDNYNYVDNLFAFYVRQQQHGPSKKLETSATACNLDFTSSESATDFSRRLAANAVPGGRYLDERPPPVYDEGSFDLEAMMPIFNERFESFMASRSMGHMGAGLPMRFADATMHKHAPKIQHPVFTTTNHGYGYKQRCQEEMPVKYNGCNGSFTNEFPITNGKAAMFGNTTFVCATTRSNVHKNLDDF
mmetsp:Transcript_23750/g.32698  ORF Transcript_23750/g.32698 Transcript_23750/m.32698 type:complete len:458 (-) Transcript_23750:157-1530(-)